LRYLQANWSFYLGLSIFRLASILAGVGARAAQGNASSRIAAQVGPFVRSFAYVVQGIMMCGAGQRILPHRCTGRSLVSTSVPMVFGQS